MQSDCFDSQYIYLLSNSLIKNKTPVEGVSKFWQGGSESN